MLKTLFRNIKYMSRDFCGPLSTPTLLTTTRHIQTHLITSCFHQIGQKWVVYEEEIIGIILIPDMLALVSISAFQTYLNSKNV